MASKSQTIRIMFAGGWATDFGGGADVGASADGTLRVPFLLELENGEYLLDGGVRKVGGQSKLNSSAVESGAAWTGIFDYWRQGTSGTPVQKRVGFIGTKVYKDDADGTWDEIKSGLQSGAVPSFFLFDDILILSTDDSTDVPMSWDQTTFQNLAGSPPNFAFGTAHKNRAWAAGVDANPSRLYYSVLLDPEDWSGTGSGNIDIDPDDGDRITGIASFKNDLWIFKGPNKGSIHRITGSSPTGDEAFARTTFARGIPCAGHNTIFHFHDDLGFMSQAGTVHSLKATAAFGDFNEAAISLPINRWLDQHVTKSVISKVWAASLQPQSLVAFAIPTDGATTPNRVVVLDHRFDPPRWAYLPAYDNVISIAQVRDPDNQGRRYLYAGCDDGFVRKLFTEDRAIDDTTAIQFRAGLPQLNFLTPTFQKTVIAAGLGIAPQGDFDITLELQRDEETAQTLTFDQAGSDVLGPAAANQFTLDTSTLAGAGFVEKFDMANDVGPFRSLRLAVFQNGLLERAEVHGISLKIDLESESMEG